MINAEKIEVLFSEIALLRDDLRKTIDAASKVKQAGNPRALADLVDKYDTAVRYSNNIKELEKASLKALKKSEHINLVSFFATLLVTMICGILIGSGIGIYLSYHQSEQLFFKEQRERKIHENLNDIRLLESLRKRGVYIGEKALLAPPEIIASTGASQSGKKGIWLKQ